MIGVPPKPPLVPPVPPPPPEPELGAGVLGGDDGVPPQKTVHSPPVEVELSELWVRIRLPNADFPGSGALSGVCEQRDAIGAARAIGATNAG